MSRTRHHKNQRANHCGHDYGARLNCNKHYTCGYGSYGRYLGKRERRRLDKKIIASELNKAK